MQELNFGIAFLAGMISFLSPCVFPLIPAYLAQLTGSSIVDQQLQADTKVVLSRSIGFVIGFSTIFLLLGASSSLVGKLFFAYRQWFEKIGGIVIIIFGLQMAGAFNFRFLMREKKVSMAALPTKTMSLFRSVVMGFLFGAGWSPCIGLVLSSILILASQSNTMWSGMLLLLVYSLGLGVPFVLVAVLWSHSLQRLRQINRLLPIIQKIGGAVLVVLGLLLFTGVFKQISVYLSRFNSF
jgi:cytochrome c-type biogenesis protein